MMIASGFVGIDVGKHSLDIYAGSASRIANTSEAISAWLLQNQELAALAA